MQRLPCGIRFGVGILSGGHIELPTLVSSLSVVLDRVVIDQTHLNGTFDVDLKWAPDVVQDDEIVGRVSPSLSTDTALADEPTIFTALQEQLGLKLQPSRSQVAVVVIDHIERLRDN